MSAFTTTKSIIADRDWTDFAFHAETCEQDDRARRFKRQAHDHPVCKSGSVTLSVVKEQSLSQSLVQL